MFGGAKKLEDAMKSSDAGVVIQMDWMVQGESQGGDTAIFCTIERL